MSASRFTAHRFIVIGAAATLAAGTFVVTNLAGAASGPSAVDYAQCTNGAPLTTPPTGCNSWINGALNGNNSQYHEDQVTPQRLLVQFTDTGTAGDTTTAHTHSVTLNYLARKGTTHAYDYLASANETQKDAATDSVRCASFGTVQGVCPTATLSDTHAITKDTTDVPPCTLGDTNCQTSLREGDGSLMVFGADFQNVGTVMTEPQHDNAGGTGDDYASTTISFNTYGTGVHNVQLLFGGHLAAPQYDHGWGDGLGAASINGGPYHIKWAAADGVSIGNRDNQIMSGAILKITPQGSLLSTTPSPTSVVFDSTTVNVSDTATLSNISSGHNGTGTMGFDLYGPFTTAPGTTSCIDPATGVTDNRISHQTGIAVSSTANTWNSTAVNVASDGPGIYQWVAHYAGDTYNTVEDGSCGDASEQVVVIGATSTQSVQDTVTVNGAASGAYVNWYLYSDNTCATLVDSDVKGDGGSDTNNALVSGSATSKSMSPTQTKGSHTYYWKVVYHDGTIADTVHGVVEACGVQQVAVQNAPA